ncbi:malto-oligosyltrehalose synthase [Mariniluteicoccus endophyticus]
MQTPLSTYRFQIRPSLTLQDAADLADYLAELGADAYYLSPLLTATTDSDHGYDTTDPTRIDPTRGGEEGWQALVHAARERGLKIVVDIVPNHLGISVPEQNPAWWDVLAKGRDSAYAGWFDIDWTREPVLVPVLGDDIENVVLADGDEGPEVRYHEHRFPVAEGTYADGDSVSDVLARQHYRLAPWREGAAQLNYRRFFAVTTLAGVRVEDEAVFDATHERVLRWVNEDHIEGLRIDHPDGLVDPGAYLQRLREKAPEQWIVAEKILEHGEVLPHDWPVEGTTGYDAMNEIGRLMVDPRAEERFTRLYRELTGDKGDLAEHILRGKRMAATVLLPAELGRLVALLPEPVDGAREAITELAAHMEVYRSYVPDGVEHLQAAADAARAERPELAAALDALVPVLSDRYNEVARRFQQFSGAVMAKGVEDTAYYRYARFVGLNEVGGNPAAFGQTLDGFHAEQERRQATQPRSMTSLSTHDTKRGEDVRARLAVLSEVGDHWAELAADFLAHGRDVPNRAFVYFLAQNVVGAGLVERERLHAYAEKAAREAADGTTWNDPDADFESAVHGLVDAVYDDEVLNDHVERFLSLIEQPGWSNSLAQKLVQLTMPGVPDVYQGTELWEDSLVDPDNRRPVDFAARRAILARDEPPHVEGTGAAKLWVVTKALRLRRDRPELFTTYAPLRAEGGAAEHLVAFDRGGAITLATRLPYTLATEGGWRETMIDLPPCTDVLTGVRHSGRVRVADVLDRLPVALLVRD